MPRFYIDRTQIKDNAIIITGNDVNHIKNVLRMKINDEIYVSDGQSKEYYCIIKEIEKNEIQLEIKEIEENSTELKSKIILFQGLPKKDKMELIIQKAVELGVHEIVPVMTNRVIVKIEDEKKEQRKLERWQLISESASKQSKRGIIPVIKPIHSFEQAMNYMKELDIAFIPYENVKGISYTREVIANISSHLSIGVFIGPEGGFEEKEVDIARANNIIPISLGKRILRTETAGLAILSILMLALDE